MLIQPCVPDFFFLLFSGLFVMTIGLKYFSCRTAISMGGVLHASAFMITAFAEDVRVFYVAFGIFGGNVWNNFESTVIQF